MSYYQNIEKRVAVLDVVQYFFANSKETLCNYRKCELLMPGCKVPYDGDKLAIEKLYPYTLNAKLNVKNGYQDKFCFKCKNEQMTEFKDNIVFT